MTLLLRRRTNLADIAAYDSWAAVSPGPVALDPAREEPGLAAALEESFAGAAALWQQLGRSLGGQRTAGWAHMPAAAVNISDFGLMLTWTLLATKWAKETRRVLLVCDDPWLFRQLRGASGVEAGSAPPIVARALSCRLRGIAARAHRACRLAMSALQCRTDSRRAGAADTVLLVYGHPRSRADGFDGYFGELMLNNPQLGRALHTDCTVARARDLGASKRSVSLHGWGNPLAALGFVLTRWRPVIAGETCEWLIRRCAALEGSTAQALAIRWQCHCQRRWLAAMRPRVVAWPWENHAWERALVRDARALGIATVGYQHSVVGAFMLNESPASNADGLASIPDHILCNGQATHDRLADWGIPADRLKVAGAMRFPEARMPRYDPSAPVFLALPFDHAIAGEMIDAALQPASQSTAFLVKDHPMTPYAFTETASIRRTDSPLGDHEALSGVVYAATTVGLEAMFAGLPTYRFRPRWKLSIDVMPRGVDIPAVDNDTMAAALANPVPPPSLDRTDSFAPIDPAVWQHHLGAS
jgi:surface carbohydrate biosynthesis protein (TIGR04326 family)